MVSVNSFISFDIFMIQKQKRLIDFSPSRPTWGIALLRHKLRTLPQDTSVIERVESKSYSDLAGMITSPTHYTM
jgi:hypothetical protein